MSTKAFQQLYAGLNRDTLTRDVLAHCYHEQIHFQDPFHSIHGLDGLHDYFQSLYSRVTHIEFTFGRQYQSGDHSLLRWTMVYQHPAINKGQPVTVDGCSELEWKAGKIIHHRDFFDAGQMLYEHLPVLGWALNKLKARMQ